jgi:hypothetical protein
VLPCDARVESLVASLAFDLMLRRQHCWQRVSDDCRPAFPFADKVLHGLIAGVRYAGVTYVTAPIRSVAQVTAAPGAKRNSDGRVARNADRIGRAATAQWSDAFRELDYGFGFHANRFVTSS